MRELLDERSWAEAVFGQCEIGDKRLTRRLVEYAARQAEQPGASAHAVCQGSGALKEGTFRFLRNDRVEPEAIAEGGFRSVADRLEAGVDVLVIEDTTTLNYHHEVAGELGEIGGVKDHPTRAFLVHSALAVARKGGEVHGLLDQVWWTRVGARSVSKSKRAYRDKEAYKWQRSSERVRARVSNTASLVWLCDREADIHEYLVDKCEHGDRFVVRAMHDRLLVDSHKRLWQHMRAQPVRLEREVEIGQRGKQRGANPKESRPARTATVQVRAGRVTLCIKDQKGGKRGEPLTVGAVYVVEPQAPEGVEPLEWMLLTTEPIDTDEQAVAVIECYERRWLIEEYHKVWKTGCRVEMRRLQTADNLQREGVILAFIATRILALNLAMRANPDKPCDEVLPGDAWKCLHASVEPHKALPARPPDVAWAYKALAKLAGWICTKRGQLPSHLTIWKGWMRLDERLTGWQLALSAMET